MASKEHKHFTSTTIDGRIDGSISILIATGIILLNAAEIAVLGRKGWKRKKAEHMILSLSCADFLVGITYITYGTWKIIALYNSDSHLVLALAVEARACFSFHIVASILHILAIAAERLYALKRPLRYRGTVTNKQIITVVILSSY